MALTEKDVKSVAEARINRKYGLRLLIINGVTFLFTLIFLVFFDSPVLSYMLMALVVVVFMGSGFIHWKRLENYKKELLGTWKENGTILWWKE